MIHDLTKGITELSVDAARLGYNMALVDIVRWLRKNTDANTIAFAQQAAKLGDDHKDRVTATSIRERP